MPLLIKLVILIASAISITIMPYHDELFAAMDPRFELDAESLTQAKSVKKSSKTRRKLPRHNSVRKSSRFLTQNSSYIVKPGDHLFKILMRDYGLTNNEAESFIEEIKRENNIYDIKRLKVGQKISIPPVRRSADGNLKLSSSLRSDVASNGWIGAPSEHSLKLDSPVTALSEQEALTMVQGVWNQIIPAQKGDQKPLALKTSTFSLTLDPSRYPTFARMDGGRIVLDQNGSIPPLVKSLIEEKDPSVKIINQLGIGRKQFMASLLESAGFYSVEENFNMEFGVDPKLTVQADFKIEKTRESLVKQDILLVNSGRTALPPTLAKFLQKEGFALYEPFASLKAFAQHDSRTVHYISATKQPEMIDSILSAFSVLPERDRPVDVFATDNNGISLSVKAERYFERAGKRYVVTSFDGDPINYTLFRILETKGYNVVILEAKDNFRKIAEKIISRMKIKGQFAEHSLLQDKSAGYSLQISGFMLDDATLPGGGLFLTDRVLDPIIKDLVLENGLSIK